MICEDDAMRHDATLIRLAACAGLAWPGLAAAQCRLTDEGSLAVEMLNQRPTTMASVNGKSTRFILDTGATFGSMARANVEALGLTREAAPGHLRLGGIGGTVQTEMTRVKSLGLANASLKDVEFLVGGTDMGMGVIGASLLDSVDLDVDLANGRLRLLRPVGCGGGSMAYWAAPGQAHVATLRPAARAYDRRSFVDVTVNGQSVRAVLDSGAQATLITRRAARRVGLDLSGATGATGLVNSGVGAQHYPAWIVPIQRWQIGDERIENSRIEVMDGELGQSEDAPEMLLGVDFFLSHHVFVANSQGRIYFTYNGGRLFTLAKAPPEGDGAQADGGPAGGAPMRAADLALRGQAHASRGELAAAGADLDAAIALGPDRAAYHLARARIALAGRRVEPAMADLGAAIGLEPGNAEALLLRARLHLARHERDAALQDARAAGAQVPAGSQQARDLAMLYVAMDRPLPALPLLDAWIRLHPEDGALPDGLNARCWARGLANVDLVAALDDCNRAISGARDHKGYFESLGLVQLRLGRNGGAQSSYEIAVAALPGSAWSHYALGLARLRQGQGPQGQADMAAARAIDPGIAARFAALGLGS
jgi:predicted aspartyl protease/tetratricopeptide (TPR) repeat protein